MPFSEVHCNNADLIVNSFNKMNRSSAFEAAKRDEVYVVVRSRVVWEVVV